MKLLIAVHHPFDLWVPPPWFARRLQREFPEVEVAQTYAYEEAERRLAEVEVMIGWSLRPEQFARARRLRWIHSTAAAVHGLLHAGIIASDVVITNASSVHGAVVAEHALAMLLALARRLPSASRYQAQRMWAQQELWRERPQPREVSGAVLGLIGVGAIGAEIARRALAFGMLIRAVRLHPEQGVNFLPAGTLNPAAVTVMGLDRVDDAVKEADFLVLAAPLTPATGRLIDSARLQRMKPEAYLINVSRGALVDEAALAEALRAGRLGGAALDVFEEEPLSPDSPLWDLPGVLISPHAGSMTDKLWERNYALLAENLRRYLQGRPLLQVVDKRSGY
jgi:phosphoglycerate dehydrogenase-like enzyme